MKMKLLSVLIVSLAMPVMAMPVIFAGCSTTPASSPTPTATPAATQIPDPWPGVSVYRNSSNPIPTRVNETFSIVLPPAPLFGWGWQNNDLSAFSLLETKTIPGSANEPNPFGPNAFLFEALETGAFQIILYVPSKPPQQLKTFDIVVKP
jgi:hypothetical protein